MYVESQNSNIPTQGVSLSEIWDVLGPFQIGTREATWGADPLECYGGFSSLIPDAKSYPSSLGQQGRVGWTSLRANEHSSNEAFEEQRVSTTSIKLVTQFQNVDWLALRAVYGWAALQWQAWVRGTLAVHGSKRTTVRIYLPAILEFEIDGERYFGGDFFAYNNAPLVLSLDPGPHVLNIRVVRDVRASGGVGNPSVEFEIYVEPTEQGLALAPHKALFPDYVNAHGFTGRVCCIPAQNTGTKSIEIVDITAESVNGKADFFLQDHSSLSIVPGQINAIGVGFAGQDDTGSVRARLSFGYRWSDSTTVIRTESFIFQGVERELSDTHKMVFKRPNGTISYALLEPPRLSKMADNGKRDVFPVLVVLHGAGVEAESTQTRDMLKEMGDIPAWVIVPTGSTLWSGDDWHTWGLADVEAAISAIPEYIQNINWSGPGADLQNLYIAGHSNGGQGTWHMLTHAPDKIRAAAPVSGYLSIQKYVPYSIWNELDPKISGILHGSLTAYRHELLIDNAKGIFIQQQHGDADDNVPPIHSRRMYQLLHEAGSNPHYQELLGKGHWDLDTMATPVLKSFYTRIGQNLGRHDSMPTKFSLVIPSTGEQIGSRGGITIDQLQFLGQLGRINVERRTNEIWVIKTYNVLRFHIGSKDYHGLYPKEVEIDDTRFNLMSNSSNSMANFVLEGGSCWVKASNADWRSLSTRSGPQYGTIFAILRTRSELQVQYQQSSDAALSIATQVSRNLYQYYSANCHIVAAHEAPSAHGNVISVMIGKPSSPGNDRVPANYPIEIRDRGVRIRTRSGLERVYHNHSGLGAIFLIPRSDERLELIVWGFDKLGAQQAARLIPALTGVGQADFVILGGECPWRGAGGVLATGFFEHDWTVSESAYIA